MNCLFWKLLTIAVLCAFRVADWQSQSTQDVSPTISPANLSRDEVLSRWADALGGRENLQDVRTVYLSGTIEMGGMKGTYVLREPIASFSLDERKGLLASTDIDAIIGGRILKRFTVTFDYPHQRMFLEPNSHFSEPCRASEKWPDTAGERRGLPPF